MLMFISKCHLCYFTLTILFLGPPGGNSTDDEIQDIINKNNTILVVVQMNPKNNPEPDFIMKRQIML